MTTENIKKAIEFTRTFEAVASSEDTGLFGSVAANASAELAALEEALEFAKSDLLAWKATHPDLTAQNAALREALKEIDAQLTGDFPVTRMVKNIARAALEAK